MASKKYYAVAKGKSGVPMILESWPACQKEVIGAKGAIYKSFLTIEEAQNFIKLHVGNGVITAASEKENKSVQDSNDIEDFEGLHIYVDGSFMPHKNNFSYGLVAIENGEVVYKDKGIGTDPDSVSLRNVAGEVMGAMKAVDYAIKNNYKEVVISYDYQGIESWALGTWKRNKELTKAYHEYMSDKMKDIKIIFNKVKGHSGDKYNDIADSLAKQALEEN